MEMYLSIAGLAFSLAALVPILLPKTRVRFWTITVAFLSLAAITAVAQVSKEIIEARAVKDAIAEILFLLTKNEKGMSFDQIYDNMYYPNRLVANAAIDELIKSRQITSEKVNVMWEHGAQFTVRRFYYNFE